MEEYHREPCPWRIVDDCGGAFTIGLVGGSIFHFIKGFRNAPTGLNNRYKGALNSIKLRSPTTAGSFASWGFSFALCDCSLVYIREKEDPWNSVISGALTGSLLSIRNGRSAMITSAIFGGLVLGLIECMGIMMSRFTGVQLSMEQQQMMEQQMQTQQPGSSQPPYQRHQYQYQ